MVYLKITLALIVSAFLWLGFLLLLLRLGEFLAVHYGLEEKRK